MERIRPMPEKFAVLPAHAFVCCMAKVRLSFNIIYIQSRNLETKLEINTAQQIHVINMGQKRFGTFTPEMFYR